MRLFCLIAMREITHVQENRETGTYHLIDPDYSATKAEYEHDRTLCGRNGTFNREVRHGHVALEAAENLCDLCRQAAEKDALMPIYERADEHAHANS